MHTCTHAYTHMHVRTCTYAHAHINVHIHTCEIVSAACIFCCFGAISSRSMWLSIACCCLNPSMLLCKISAPAAKRPCPFQLCLCFNPLHSPRGCTSCWQMCILTAHLRASSCVQVSAIMCCCLRQESGAGRPTSSPHMAPPMMCACPSHCATITVQKGSWC